MVDNANGKNGGGPASAGTNGGSGLLPIIQKEDNHPCFNCAKCCQYVAIEIDKPTTMKEYDYIVWYLYHGGVSVFVDFDAAWFVKFETRCDHLTETGLCGVYDTRPAICRDFDWRDCENHLKDEPADKWVWDDAESFMTWFEERRPKTYKRFLRYMRKREQGKAEPELKRVKVTEILPTPPGR